MRTHGKKFEAAAIEQGLKTGARTQRERDYIAALAKLFENWDKTEHRPRALAWEAAMEQLVQRYPDDDEARIFYALALFWWLGLAVAEVRRREHVERLAEEHLRLKDASLRGPYEAEHHPHVRAASQAQGHPTL